MMVRKIKKFGRKKYQEILYLDVFHKLNDLRVVQDYKIELVDYPDLLHSLQIQFLCFFFF